jgi:hypothetical protein
MAAGTMASTLLRQPLLFAAGLGIGLGGEYLFGTGSTSETLGYSAGYWAAQLIGTGAALFVVQGATGGLLTRDGFGGMFMLIPALAVQPSLYRRPTAIAGSILNVAPSMRSAASGDSKGH